MHTIELYKIKYELAPAIMDSILNRRNVSYNVSFRNLEEFQSEEKELFSMDTLARRN